MVATGNGGKNSPLDFVPAVDHLVVTEAEDDKIDGAQLCVTCSIKLKANRIDVVRSAIHFNNEPPADQKVDAFAIDPHLASQRQLMLGKSDQRDGLGAALTDSVSQMQDACNPRHGIGQTLPLRAGYQWV